MARTDSGAAADEAAPQALDIFNADQMLQGFPDHQTLHVE
jgi:hypothetical protein